MDCIVGPSTHHGAGALFAHLGLGDRGAGLSARSPQSPYGGRVSSLLDAGPASRQAAQSARSLTPLTSAQEHRHELSSVTQSTRGAGRRTSTTWLRSTNQSAGSRDRSITQSAAHSVTPSTQSAHSATHSHTHCSTHSTTHSFTDSRTLLKGGAGPAKGPSSRRRAPMGRSSYSGTSAPSRRMHDAELTISSWLFG